MPGSRHSGAGKMAVYRREEPNARTVAIPATGDVVEVCNEDEWITRRRREVVTTKNIETRVKRQLLVDEDGNVVEDSGPIISTDTTVDTTEKQDENTEHKKGADDQPVPEGYVAVPGGAVVSERFTNITNTHEQKDDVRQEEEVHHLGDYTNEEVSRAIREGEDARGLLPRRRAGSGHSGALVDPRRSGQRRVVHQSGKTWRTVDTEDIHEKTKQDEHGELVTETARTHQQEQFHNVLVPDDGEDSVQEQHRSGSRSRRHVKDEDTLEFYSVPRGGRLGDGIKLGEGLRYVQENVQEERDGDDNIESLSVRMRQMRELGYKPEGQTLAKTPVEYQEEEKTRRKETHKWLDCHFGSESGHSGSSEDGEPRRGPQVTTYEFHRSSGSSRKNDEQPTTWGVSKEVRQTPKHTYIRESQHGGERGDFDRMQVLPSSGRRPVPELESGSRSPGKSRGNVRFLASSPERRRSDVARLSPPTQSPPPPPPPRHRKKGRDKQSPPELPDNHYASSPIRERYEPSRRREPYQPAASSPRHPSRLVREYHFSGGESGRGSSRDRHEYSERRDSYSTDSRERTGSTEAPLGGRREERRARFETSARHHRSTDQLDRYEERRPDAARFGGSMVNVTRPAAARPAPERSSVQRSNSLYSREEQDASPAGRYDAALKSPDIISKIQRTASWRRGEQAERRSSHTSSSSQSYRPPPQQDGGKKESFMRGLLKKAPDVYGVLHASERKDSKTPSPRDMTPPPPLERQRIRSEQTGSYTPAEGAPYRPGQQRSGVLQAPR